jgi:RNA polymerase sigma factor (sigma-70 family)
MLYSSVPQSEDSQSFSAATATGAGYFPSTHWSVVLSAGDASVPNGTQALDKLCRAYWRPIYAYVRRRGYGPADAEDLTQAFFEHFLERKLLTVVDRQRGRFRTFLLHACEYFLAKEWRDARRLKRGGGQEVFSLDIATGEEWYQREPADERTPERLYEREWALTLLDLVMDQLRQEWAAAGKETSFQTLQAFLSGERKSITCAQAALELGMSEGAVRTAVHRLRQRYGEILRTEVAQTLSRPEDLEDELRHLLAVL